MNAKPKYKAQNNKWLAFSPLFAILLLFTMTIGIQVFDNEFRNVRSFLTSPPPAHTIEDSLLPKRTYWETFKNANTINSKFSQNNDNRPKDLILYKNAFVLDSNDVACGCDKAVLLKDEYGGDQCREIYCNNFDRESPRGVDLYIL